MLGHSRASHALFTSFELLHLRCCDLHLQCMKERCCHADAPDEWMHIRTTISGVSPEMLHLMRSADEDTQVEPVSYQAADMWAVGLLLVLMLTGETPFTVPDVTGKSSLSIPDEAEMMAFVAKRHEQWVCVWIAVQCFACRFVITRSFMLLLSVNPSLSAVLET
jgi:serine/threonine protein kinase